MVFVNVSRSRHEMERTGRQIENGRFASQLLADDIVNAGYFGEFDPRAVGAPTTKPDPCSTALADMKSMVMMHVQGYAAAAAKPSCISDVRTGTAVVAVRRSATCTVGDANCDAAVAGAIYIQSSLCNSELANPLVSTHYVVAANAAPSPFPLHRHDCATPASLRAYVMHIYFVANNNDPGDGIPTLKRAELGANGGFSVVPLVEGIENLQLEFGLDTNGDSVPDALSADPGTYGGCNVDPCYISNWLNVVTVRIHLLSRSTERSPGYTDTKAYPLGPQADGTELVVGPFNDSFKRHTYAETIRMNNPAGRRE
jgi:type IV pilus assembly protein PilW